MSLDDVRIQAHVVQLKARQTLTVSLVVGLSLAVLCSVAIQRLSLLPVRITAGAILGLTLVVIYKAYGRMWPRFRLSSEAAVRGCVEFYRRELETQYRSLQLIWRFLIPIALFTFLMWGSVFRSHAAQARYLVAGLLLLVLFERRREARKVNRMLAALATFEKENS